MAGKAGAQGRAGLAVVGTGSWGVTLAVLAARNAAGSVDEGQGGALLLARTAEEADSLRQAGCSPRLPGVAFPPRLTVTADASALRRAAVVLFVVPAQSMRANVQAVAGHLDGGAILVSASKGLEIGSAWRMSEVIAQEVTRAAGTAEGEDADGVMRRVAALSGPNLAREIAAGKAASTVVACPDEQAAARVQEALMAPHFRVYTSTDVTGVELGGALKNVIALGAGMADGLQAGDNGKAALMTRGLAEIARLGKAAGAEPLTFSGLAGLGDLIATCMSGLSRNRTLGEALARGASLSAAQAGMGQVTEGVTTTVAALQLARRYSVEMPITALMHRVLFEGLSPGEAGQALMQRDPKRELEGFL
ncbi:MAG TPA: NAD(P)H-dependent glycerol-3-phosphate dehydrogenase [Chloroflexota bacterium]|nr:NAD(P)H-dependent glycerol-3-phosphate dehydrogenase [Chloroflexota bacterium]